MNHCLQIARIGLALLFPALLTTGCVTQALWEDQRHRPADDPHLTLSLALQTDDILVQYLEHCEDTGKIQPRAYWLFAHSLKQPDHIKPEFVLPDRSIELIPIPMLRDATATNALPASGYCAAPLDYQRGFNLWKEGRHLGRFFLPSYLVKPRVTAGRIALTPLAVTADVVIVGAACAVVAAVVVAAIYLESESDDGF